MKHKYNIRSFKITDYHADAEFDKGSNHIFSATDFATNLQKKRTYRSNQKTNTNN